MWLYHFIFYTYFKADLRAERRPTVDGVDLPVLETCVRVYPSRGQHPPFPLALNTLFHSGSRSSEGETEREETVPRLHSFPRTVVPFSRS